MRTAKQRLEQKKRNDQRITARRRSYFFQTQAGGRDWLPGTPSSPEKYRERMLRRFWTNVDKAPGLGPKGECWEWLGSTSAGYGQMILKLANGKRRPIRTHVIAWVHVYGHPQPPKGWHVCHDCNNKKCVRESHLFPGTPRTNVRHAQATGIMRRAETKDVPVPISWVATPSPRQRQLLRQRRHAKGIGFRWMCRALEIDQSQLSKLETGNSGGRGLRIEKLNCLIRMLEIPESEFNFQECEFINAKYVDEKPDSKMRLRYAAERERLGFKDTPEVKRGRFPDVWLKHVTPSNRFYNASAIVAELKTFRIAMKEASEATGLSVHYVREIVWGRKVKSEKLIKMLRYVEALKQQRAA